MKFSVFAAVFLIGSISCAASGQDSTGPIRIKVSEMVNGLHPDYPWFHYEMCPGFVEDEYLELLAYEFEEVPTAGRGQWVTLTYLSKTRLFIDTASMTVKWAGIPFYSGSMDVKELLEPDCPSRQLQGSLEPVQRDGS